MRTFETPLKNVPLDIGGFYLSMGFRTNNPLPEIARYVESSLAELREICVLRYGYRMVPAGEITSASIVAGGVRFDAEKVISPCFEGVSHFAVFVGTAGTEFDRWFVRQKASGDIMFEYVAHNIGSELAEAAGQLLAAELEKEAASIGLRESNPYSPGYCGWNVSEQRKIFSLLPPSPCGIILTESCLMLPIKSISGLIGLGPAIEKKAYGCAICDRTECFRRKT